MNGFTPSVDQIVAQLRILIPVVGTLVSALGWATADHVGPVVSNLLLAIGPISYVVSSVWSLYANSRASILASAAKPVTPGAEPPQIQLPLSEKKLADSLPSNVTVKQ